MPVSAAPNDTIKLTVEKLRKNFNAHLTRSLSYRRQQLEGLKRFFKTHEEDIKKAIYEDMGRPGLEATLVDVDIPLREIKTALKNLSNWTKPERVHTALIGMPGKSRIYKEPLGVVLIIGPWNYPVNLVLLPLVGAIAAGNCALIKPSEVSANTSKLISELLPKYLDPNSVQVIEGGVAETTELLAQRFDHIFYTGNGTVGQIVMEAAAKHLTPVTLELGGKCPAIVDKTADLVVASRRIIWGKFFNAGQTCIAPDYVLVHEDIEEALLNQMKKTLHDFFGDDISSSKDYGRVINKKHYQRIMNFLTGGGEIVVGGTGDEKEVYIAPTILRNVPVESPVMIEEIFGPVLPVLKVRDIDAAIEFVNARPKPLALYYFSNDSEAKKKLIASTSSGAVSINHTSIYFGVLSLPFGGVGASGMGAYHAKATFDTFSHRKSVLLKPNVIDPDFAYPPYSKKKENWLRKLI